MMVYVGSRAFSINRSEGRESGIWIVVSALCLPRDALVRAFPDTLLENVITVTTRPLVVVRKPTRPVGRLGQTVKRSKKIEDAVEGEENNSPISASDTRIEEEGGSVVTEKGRPQA